MKNRFSRKALKQMEQAACREEWIDLVKLERLAEFAAWLTDDFHAWHIVARLSRPKSINF